MIVIENIESALNRTLNILIKDSIWNINFKTLYADYIVYRMGDKDILAVGWQWDNLGENFTRCIKVQDNQITDYYHSYEKYTTQETGIFSNEVDPFTEEKICEYIITDKGVHKYDMNGNVIQENNQIDSIPLSVKDIIGGTSLMKYQDDILLISRKPYGDILYIDIKNHRKALKNAINRRSNI